MKLVTCVEADRTGTGISLQDRVMVLGSCFADNIGEKMVSGGFSVCINPFGTLYNPASIASAVERLSSGAMFSPEECVEMGAGAGLVCSFSHHTRFARKSVQEFLDNANTELEKAAAFWKSCNKVVVTLGTAQVWKRNGEVVSNCLKRPASEFSHEMLTVEETQECLRRIAVSGKEFLFTISPIRHLSYGAVTNTISKSTLHLALASWMKETDTGVSYFPAYEIMMDELRDYRFYAEDLCHPSPVAIEYLWERFLETSVPASELEHIRANEKAFLKEKHRKILK